MSERNVILLLVLLVIGCGKQSQKIAQEPLTPMPAQPILIPLQPGDGQFLGLLYPLNQFVSGKVTGAFTWSKENDEVIVDLRFNGGLPTAGVIHAQNIHQGKRCPDEADDLNEDGYIDAVEGEKVYGKILIPLDNDINSQLMGYGTFPVADEFGSYIYSSIASYNKIISDLTEEDLNSEDPFVKLGPEGQLSLKEKIVVVQGINATTIIPFSVKSNNSFANFQTLPIACGVIKEIKSVPGTRHRDETDLKIPVGGGSPGGIEGDDGAVIRPPARSRTP